MIVCAGAIGTPRLLMLPVIPNVPLNATVLAVAEKAAALITKAPL